MFDSSASERGSVHRPVLVIAAIAALGGLLFGFDTAVIAGTTGALTTAFRLTPALLGITVSSALVGTIGGAAAAGSISDRYGRRACLRALGLLYFASALGCAFAWSWSALLAFRVLSGIAIGGSSVLSPMYIAELSPARVRGRLVGMFQLNVVVGILAAYLSNFLVGNLVHAFAAWRWKLGVAALPALVFFAALFLIPESPRWLVRAGRSAEALRVLRQTDEREAKAELKQIEVSLETERGAASEAVFQKRYAFPIFLAIAIGMFNQLSGINAILYYLNSIFESAGFSRVSSDVQAVLIGFANLLGTVIALAVIDRLGRRQLLLIGSVGCAACMAGVAVIFKLHHGQFALVWLLVGFIGFFSFSQGAVIWVYISEVFPNRVRAKGQSIGSFTHWLMNALVSALFPVVAATWGSAPFFFFAGMMVLQFVVVFRFFPETRGVRLEAMEQRVQALASGS